MAKTTCPLCLGEIAVEKAPVHRPFGCPNCQKIIVPTSYYAKFASPGCFVIVVIGTASLVLAGTGWGLSFLVSLIGALLLTIIAFHVLDKYFPRPTRIVAYVCRTQTNLISLAEFLETVAAAESWTVDLDRRLELFKHENSKDDLLENLAIECIANFRQALRNPMGGDIPRISVMTSHESKREELRAIARDLRLAENQYRPKETT